MTQNKIPSSPIEGPQVPSTRTKSDMITTYRYMVIFFAICSLIHAAFSHYKTQNIANEAEQRGYVITNEGTFYAKASSNNPKDNEIEAANHAKMFLNLMYAYDEKSFDSNTEAALHLIGKDGQIIYNQYVQNDTKNMLTKLNLVATVEIDSVIAIVDKLPYEVFVFAKQKQEASTFRQKKTLWASMQMRKISRSPQNPHGLLIEKFSIKKAVNIEEE